MRNKIKFTAVSISWTEGGIMHFDVKASVGSVIFIDWGDGRTTAHSFHNEREMVKFSHNYFPENYSNPPDGQAFDVEISANPDCRIIGFDLRPADMIAIDLDVSACPELEKLTYGCYFNDGSSNLDLSHNTALKYLNCSECNFTKLDLAANTALEYLDCSRNRLSHLSLTTNIALKELICENNNMEKIFIYYAPQLRKAAFEDGNNIDDETKMRMQELILGEG